MTEESQHEVMFDEETAGVLVAGRTTSTCFDMTRAEFGELARKIEALGKARNVELEVVASGDLSDTGPEPDEEVETTAAIGLTIARGGSSGPEQVEADAIVRELNAAKALPRELWSEIAALLAEDKREAFLGQEVGLHFLCAGPLAAAHLAFGTEGGEEDEGEGKYIHGQDMGQDTHETGVWGEDVAYVQYESPDHVRVDFSAAAHQERLAKFPGGAYYLIARYD